MSDWNTMDSAPRGGQPFLVQCLPYGDPALCMRRVRLSVNNEGHLIEEDLGAWLIVRGIDDEFERGCTTAEPRWSVARDSLNDVAAWRWREIPNAPTEVLNEIRQSRVRPT